MRIRLRVILVIIIVNVLIIFFSITAGTRYVRKNIEKSQESDLILISDIADHFLSSEIEILELKASEIIQNLSASGESEWLKILANQETLYPDFIGTAIFDIEGRLAAESGRLPAPVEILDDLYIKQAFQGKKMLSSTYPAADGVVFYFSVPLSQTNDKILVITIPGMYFSKKLSTFVIWETGHIFIDDSEGYIIANIRENWVQNRFNFIKMAETDPQYTEIASIIKRVVNGETGIGYFSLSGVTRICAYRPVSGSNSGWTLGVIAPLPESPFRGIDEGLIVVGIVGFLLSVVAAFFASIFIKKPFEEIAALKEAAESNSKYKSKFLATMSHEIRTPMNVILGISENQLLNQDYSDEIRKAFENIYDSSSLLLNIINDILDLSKIEAGKFELNIASYEVLSIISDVVNMNNMRFGHKPIDFQLQVDEKIPVNLVGDELRIKQILNNLLSNAFKYTNEGLIELFIMVEPLIEDKSVILIIIVRDTGQGMTPEQIERLFDEYSRFNLDANRTTVGTGLGMTITRNLVKMMNGEISANSIPGEGTTFTVRIPHEIASSVLLGKEAVENIQKFNFANTTRERRVNIKRELMPYGKVLVVDDMKSNLDVAKLLLTPYQLNIETAASGFDAIEIIRAGKVYDIIFMDHMMPKLDGIETTRKLREEGYNNPIIALTANAIAGQQEFFLASGFDAYISKPIDLRQLNDSLNKFIRDKERKK